MDIEIQSEMRADIKSLLKDSAGQCIRLDKIEMHLEKLNGSVAKQGKRIGIIESFIKYNKGIVFGITCIVSIIWAVVTYFN